MLPAPLPRSKLSLAQWLPAIAVGILGLWQFHIPQFASFFDKFPGDRGDARLVAYLMEHWYQVFQGVVSWRSPAMFYPVEGTIGYADLVLGYGILYSGFRVLGLGIFEAAELTIILFNFLNYLVCFILLHKILRLHLLASIAGAAFFAFNGPKLVQLGHLQLQPLVFLPLAVIFIVLFVRKRATLSQLQAFGLIALAALSLSLQLLTGFYPGWFFIFWAALFLLLTLVFKNTRTVVLDQLRRFWPAVAGSVAVFVVALVPFIVAYLPIMKSVGGRPYIEIQNLIPTPWSLLATSTRNYLWGELSAALQARHPMSPELQISIGLVPSIAWLCLIGFAIMFVIRKDKRTNFLFIAQVIIATSLVYVLGMRYRNEFSPWQFVYSFVPGAQAIRGVARYALVLALPMGIAFAFAIHVLIEKFSRHRHRPLLLTGLLIVVTFGLAEQFGRKEGFDGFSISAETAYLNRNAQSLSNNCSSFYVAVKPAAIHNQFEYQIDAAFVALIKRVPTINGYSGQLPPNWHLWEVMDPAYENNVKSWINQQQIKGEVCRLFLNETSAAEDIADPQVFIRQQYLDILRREPDASGLETWLTKLSQCPRQGGRGSDKNCDREFVSLAILDSNEFSERSYFVIRLYLATLGRLPTQREFVQDRDAIVSAETAELKSHQQQLIDVWVQRPEFKRLYDSLSNAEFVDKLLQTGANSSANRAELVSRLDARQMTRAQVVQAVVDDAQTVSAFKNQAFVLMQYFANLNRDPEQWEFQEHLDRLNATGNRRQLVSDFIYSVEYRKRFGYVN